jgi:23S rRNA (cytosine1962-C5)-methyltransferase
MEHAVLKPKEERRLVRGHPWAYRNEFARLPELADGALVDVLAHNGRLIGRGFYQAEGGIAVRLLSRKRVAVESEFFRERLGPALALRERLYPGERVYRWVYGESDGLPGLVADRYDALVNAQTSCAFYGGVAQLLADAFLGFEGVEGLRMALPDRVERFGKVENPAACAVNGVFFSVDAERGQKTGLFLDQRENWKALARFVRGGRVLDGHCYTGAWALHAARFGAKEVLGVDTSDWAIRAAREQSALNGVDGICRFETADIQDVLKRDERYGVIVLDPPALAKSRQNAGRALGLYQALNRDAMKALGPGGVLITSSCSHFVDTADFLEALKRAAVAARRTVRVLEVRGAAPDHPVLLSMPETAYLKCVVAQVSE